MVTIAGPWSQDLNFGSVSHCDVVLVTFFLLRCKPDTHNLSGERFILVHISVHSHQVSRHGGTAEGHSGRKAACGMVTTKQRQSREELWRETWPSRSCPQWLNSHRTLLLNSKPATRGFGHHIRSKPGWSFLEQVVKSPHFTFLHICHVVITSNKEEMDSLDCFQIKTCVSKGADQKDDLPDRRNYFKSYSRQWTCIYNI